MNPENLTLLEALSLPAGSVVKDAPDYDGDRPAALTKQDDGKWTCDRCEDPHMLSLIYRSDHTYSLKSLGELPKGFVFGLDNLELSKFAPEGTLVSDRDNDGAVWERIGKDWLHGVTHEDRLFEADNWRVNWNRPLSPAWGPYTVVSKCEDLSGDDEVPHFKGQGDPQNEVSVVSFGSDVPIRVFDISTGAEKPSITESLVNITNALERIAAALEEKK